MWLLFYVMDSLSVKFLQECKQAIQWQPFLRNANLPTDNHPLVYHRELEIDYAKCHQHRQHYRRIHRHIHRRILVRRHITESSKTFTTKWRNHRRIVIRRYITERQQNATITDGFTDRFVDDNTDGSIPSVICRSHILPTEIRMDRAISKVCELMGL